MRLLSLMKSTTTAESISDFPLGINFYISEARLQFADTANELNIIIVVMTMNICASLLDYCIALYYQYISDIHIWLHFNTFMRAIPNLN